MNPFAKFDKIIIGQCKIIDPSSWRGVEEHKLLKLAEHMRDSRESDSFTLTTALSFLCAHKGGAEAVKIMLDTTPVDVNRSCLSYDDKDKKYFTYCGGRLIPPLHIAIENNNVDIVKVLLQQTKGLQRKNGKRRLKRQKIDVNIKSGKGRNFSPLLRATEKATTARHFTTQLDIIKLLLQQQNIDISQADSNGKTSLAVACRHGDITVVRLLLGRDRHLLNSYSNSSSLLHACCYYRFDVMHYLLHNVEITIEANIINFTGFGGNTALHFVICKNKNRGSTPSHAAVMRRNNIEFKTLIHSSDASELTMQDNDGNTPLHLASALYLIFMVKELCDLITNPNDLLIKNNRGQTAYDIAHSFNGSDEVADCIDKRVYELTWLHETCEEEICLKDFRFIHDLFNTELDDRFFKKDYKPSRPLQLSS